MSFSSAKRNLFFFLSSLFSMCQKILLSILFPYMVQNHELPTFFHAGKEPASCHALSKVFVDIMSFFQHFPMWGMIQFPGLDIYVCGKDLALKKA